MTKIYKEKIDKEIRVRIQSSLYEQLQKKCDENYKNFSELMREIVVNYLKEAKWYDQQK